MKLRTMIDPDVAAVDALNAGQNDVENLAQMVTRQRDRVAQGESAIEADSEFHYAIATAANNRVVLRVVDVLMGLLKESRERSLQVAGRPERSLAGHQRILQAIRRHDAQAAEGAMRRHLEEIETVVLGLQIQQNVGG